MSPFDPTVAYRPIPVSEHFLLGYLVGDDGSVFSCKDSQGRATGHWRRLKPTLRTRGGGYLFVATCVGNKRKYWQVGRLVLTAFVGPCPPGMECCHEDDNRTNNRLGNLKWDTRQNNVKDRDKRGRQAVGRKIHTAKLNPADIPEIKRLHAAGMGFRAISRRYGVVHQTIRQIVLGERWKHIESTPPAVEPPKPAVRIVQQLLFDD